MSLPRSAPAAQGVDPASIGRLLDALAAADVELHSLMVLRHGQVVAEGWWDPYEPHGLHLLYSLSKSFTSTAIGLAVHEGLLSVDDRVVDFFPELAVDPDPRLARLTVRHLLSMASGHREDTLEQLDRSNLVGSFLAIPLEEEPGSWFTYNQGCTLTLSAILTRLTGQRLLDYLRPRLLEPLGIAEAYWQGVGPVDLGFSGLHLTTEAVAAFGQLYLQRGRWQGRQLVEESWVAEAIRVQVDTPREPNPDWRQGYGYQFWRGRDGYRGDGAFGQFCLVLPEHDAVVATTAAVEDMQRVLECVRSELLPGLGSAGRPDGAASDALSSRLAALGLPVVVGAQPAVTLPWRAAPAADSDDPARITAIEGDVEGGWRLEIADGRATYSVACGDGVWVRSTAEVLPGARLATAASGGWTAGATFTAELVLVQTPHRMTLTCDCTAGVTTARWHTAPLGLTAPSELALEVARF